MRSQKVVLGSSLSDCTRYFEQSTEKILKLDKKLQLKTVLNVVPCRQLNFSKCLSKTCLRSAHLQCHYTNKVLEYLLQNVLRKTLIDDLRLLINLEVLNCFN